MKLIDILDLQQVVIEARKKPAQNTIDQVILQLENIANKYPMAYVTFTSVPILGAYPQSPYNTPLGICAYPIQYVIDEQMDVPYAGDNPYIIVFVVNGGNYIDLSRPDKEDLYRNILSASTKVLGPQSIFKPRDLTIKSIWFALYDTIHKKIHPHSTTGYNPRDDDNEGPYGILSRKILRRAGYDGVIDPGMGLIHENEPTQSIFFNTKTLKTITMIRNKAVRYIKPKHYHTIDNGDQWLARLNQAISARHRDRDVEKGVGFDFRKDLIGSIAAACSSMTMYCIIFNIQVPAFERLLLESSNATGIYEHITRVKKDRWPEAEHILHANGYKLWGSYVLFMQKLGITINDYLEN